MLPDTANTDAATPVPVELDSQDVYGVAQLATEGVAGLTSSSPPVGMGELLTGRRAKGITITREDDALSIDLPEPPQGVPTPVQTGPERG